jgi:hypothetical protein
MCYRPVQSEYFLCVRVGSMVLHSKSGNYLAWSLPQIPDWTVTDRQLGHLRQYPNCSVNWDIIVAYVCWQCTHSYTCVYKICRWHIKWFTDHVSSLKFTVLSVWALSLCRSVNKVPRLTRWIQWCTECRIEKRGCGKKCCEKGHTLLWPCLFWDGGR